MPRGGRRIGSGKKKNTRSWDELNVESIEKLIHQGMFQKEMRVALGCDKKAIRKCLEHHEQTDLIEAMDRQWRLSRFRDRPRD